MTTWSDEQEVHNPAQLPRGLPAAPIQKLSDAVVDGLLTEVTALYEHRAGRFIIHIKNSDTLRVWVKELDL